MAEIETAGWAGVYAGIPSTGENEVYRGSLLVSVSNNKGGENPFLVVKKRLSGSVMRSHSPPNPYWYVSKPGPSNFGLTAMPAISDVAWNTANLWARTNPARPVVRLPVFWLELRDIPDMIRQAGRFLKAGRNWKQYVRPGRTGRDLATANLAFQFGWLPLVGDLYKLANFTAEVDKRRKSIVGSTRGGVLRRRIPVGSTTWKIPFAGGGYAGFGEFAAFPVELEDGSGTSTAHAVMKWTMGTDAGGLPLSDPELRKTLLGLRVGQQLTNAWEALPWSWLIDYFANIGDVLDAGNTTLATPHVGCIVQKTVMTVSHKEYIGNSLDLSAGQVTFTVKKRTPVENVGGISVQLPILEAGQLSILASLAYLKGGLGRG